MARLEDRGEAPYRVAARTPELDEMSTSDSGSEEEVVDGEEEAAATPKLLSSPPASPGAAPEVRCLWEDCGQTFTNLQPFIEHLHSCTYAPLTSPHRDPQVAVRV